jgi:gluconolactonase
MVSKPEKIAEGIFLPEGPTWCEDGTLVVTAVAEGKLYRIWPETRRKEVIADTAGGPNGSAPASGGCFLVTQNGGLDFDALIPGMSWPERRAVSPGLQLARPDGKVIRLLEDMQAPNDLVVGPDNTIYFTDPHPAPAPPNSTLARLMARSPDGTLRMIADQFAFCNGIQREDNGDLVVTEGNGLMRVTLDGHKEWIIENLSHQHAVDGFCIDAEGRFYLAAGMDHGVRVIEGNTVVDFLPLQGKGGSTNCCFGGPDNRWLFLTDGLPGDVWMWTDMPTPGQKLHPWQVPPELLMD